MTLRWTPTRVLVYRHPVDMRKQMDGLSALVAAKLGGDPADRTAYIFIGRCSRRVKVLIWHLNGYWLLYKRLESQRFHWPDWFGENDTIELDIEQIAQRIREKGPTTCSERRRTSRACAPPSAMRFWMRTANASQNALVTTPSRATADMVEPSIADAG